MLGLITYRVMGRLRVLRTLAVAASLAAAGMLAFGTSARADNDIVYVSSTKNASIKVAKGKPKTIMTNAAFYQIVIGDPEIANVNPLTDKSFYVLGNNLGTTGIALFDENKQLVGTVDIEVTLDTDQLASTIRASVPDAKIKVGSANGRVVLSGEADDAVAAEKANKIATRFSGNEEVINSVNISSSQQVQLNVRFVEINRQAGQDLGAKYSANFAYGIGGRDVTIDPGDGAGGRHRRDHRPAAVERRVDRHRHQGAGRAWPGPAAGRAEPDRPLRPDGELSRRRRIPDPGFRGQRQDLRHLQEIRRQPGFQADRAEGRAGQPGHRAGSVLDRRLGLLQYRQHFGARLHRAPRQDVGRPEERPELHDRRVCCSRRTTSPPRAFPASASCRCLGRCSRRNPISGARPTW